MPSLRIAVPLLMLALLSLPGPALAGPPQGVSGKMVLDEVADGLREYRAAATPEVKLAWLARLAPRDDSRVSVALGEAWVREGDGLSPEAFRLILRHIRCDHDDRRVRRLVASLWWELNEADLRCRAAQLPQ
jgi:hypothetical protein